MRRILFGEFKTLCYQGNGLATIVLKVKSLIKTSMMQIIIVDR